jgi:glutamyl-tRNA reductase
MPLRIFGLSHKTAPIAIREQVAIGIDQLPDALQDLRQCRGVHEALIVSTCNRTELYCQLDSESNRHPVEWLVRYQGAQLEILAPHIYTHHDERAVQHVLRVASGLDSMVVGEPQILGQLKQAYDAAVSSGTAGKLLNRLLQHSFSVAKRVRTETAIGETPVSVAYAAVRLAKQIHGDLSDKTALLIGAGDTITLVANHLSSNGIGKLLIANRTLARAEELAERYAATALTLDAMATRLAEVDIIVSSTASKLPVITHDAIALASRQRRNDSIFIVDLAVPRDVEPSVADIDNVYLYGVDDLDKVINANVQLREAAAVQAEEMVNIHTQDYMDWLQAQDTTQTIIAYRRRADAIREELVEKARRRLAAGDDAQQVVTALANGLVNKLTHHSTAKLREATTDGRDDLLRSAREILDLADETNRN